MELRNMPDLWEEYVNIGKNNIKLNQSDVKKTLQTLENNSSLGINSNGQLKINQNLLLGGVGGYFGIAHHNAVSHK